MVSTLQRMLCSEKHVEQQWPQRCRRSGSNRSTTELLFSENRRCACSCRQGADSAGPGSTPFTRAVPEVTWCPAARRSSCASGKSFGLRGAMWSAQRRHSSFASPRGSCSSRSCAATCRLLRCKAARQMRCRHQCSLAEGLSGL